MVGILWFFFLTNYYISILDKCWRTAHHKDCGLLNKCLLILMKLVLYLPFLATLFFKITIFGGTGKWEDIWSFQLQKNCAILKWNICVFLVLVTSMVQSIALSFKINSILQKLPLNFFLNCDLGNCEVEKEDLFTFFSVPELYAG